MGAAEVRTFDRQSYKHLQTNGTNTSLGTILFFSVSGERSPGREKTLGVLTVSDFECPLCIRSEWIPG